MLDRIRRRLTFANVMSSVAVFLAMGGSAYAVTAIDKNSVRSRHIVNGDVKSADLANAAVTASKLRSGSVNSATVVDDSLTGSDVDESRLGAVPSAQNAGSLGGIAAAGYGRGFSQASVAIQQGTSLALTVPGVGTLEIGCDAAQSRNQDPDDRVTDITFRNTSGSDLVVATGFTQTEGAGATTAVVNDDASRSFPPEAQSVHFELVASELGANGTTATFQAGGEQLPNSDACQGAIQAVKSG